MRSSPKNQKSVHFLNPAQEAINLITHNMVYLHGEETVLLVMAVGQKHITGEDGPDQKSIANTCNILR